MRRNVRSPARWQLRGGWPALKEIADRAVAEAERQAIRLALQAARGNKSEAARLLGVDYKTLHVKMEHYAIEVGDFRRSLTAPLPRRSARRSAWPFKLREGTRARRLDY